MEEKMFRKLSMKIYIFILLTGEIMIVSAGILNGMNTEQLASFIIAYTGIVAIFFAVSMNIDYITGILIKKFDRRLR